MRAAGRRTVRLRELLAEAGGTAHGELSIGGLGLDSRDVEPGDLYVALGGAVTHGIRHAAAAARRGALAVALDPADIAAFDADAAASLEELLERGVPLVEVASLASRVADIASRFHGHPDRALTLVAVTGTDGKTSVCRFVADALTALGTPCGYIGTLGWGMGESLSETALTTPDALAARRMLAALRERGARAVALEASSHALDTDRLAGLDIDVAVLTNLGRDHLDYHGDIDAYRAAKARLFEWPSLSAVVVNGEDAFGRELAESVTARRPELELVVYRAGDTNRPAPEPRTIESREPEPGELEPSVPGPSGSATEAGRVRHLAARGVRTSANGLSFTLDDGDDAHRVDSALMGRFNVDNLLACHGVLRALGHPAGAAAAALAELAPVAGRMERFTAAAEGGSCPTVIVDYAHTPQALAAALAAARDHCPGELWVVFGCGGDRDRGKRAPMGRAAEAADRVVVTDDNPRREASADIIEAVLGGMRDASRAEVVPDRASAIAHAVRAAGAGDVVLVAGKGHEDYQIVGERKLALSDRACVHELLAVAC